LRSIHASAQFVAACPKRTVYFSFLYSHALPL
jgi:hypothetical protein